MPPRPKRPCAHPGCPELVLTGYCELHKKQEQKRQDEQRGNFRERGYDSRWDKVRRLKLRRNPLCEVCLKKGRATPAKIVHHIVPLRKGGKLLAADNLMSVCRTCHDELHRST